MSIERKAISAFKWAMASKLVVQTVSWAGTLIVIRLLSPEDYGLMAKISVVCGIATAIAELGLGAAIVRAVELPEADLRKIYGISLLFGVGVTALVASGSPLLAALFHEPRLLWPIAGASLQILVGSLAVVQQALATRDLSFRHLAKIEMAAGISSIAVTLLLAVLGVGVWALVLGTLFGAVVRSSALLWFGRRVAPLFSVRGIGEQLKFGLTIVGNRISYFVVVQSDVLIGSAYLSTTEIGQYAVALQLATLPMAKVMGTINDITMPAVARQQDDRPRLHQSVLKALSVIALLAFPILWGISAVAPELVHVLFGTKWLSAVPALAILPLVVPIRMLCSVLFTTSLAMGGRQLDLRNTVVNFALLPTGFFVGAHWGLVGLCSAWLVSVPLAYAFNVPAVVRFIGLRPGDILAACAPPAVAAAAMYAAIASLRAGVDDWPALGALLALCAAGAVAYIAVMAVIARNHLLMARNFARSMLNRTAPKGS